jgi:hypothetical protein
MEDNQRGRGANDETGNNTVKAIEGGRKVTGNSW